MSYRVTMPDGNKIPTLGCPHCQKSMRLTGGNAVFSYWMCKFCKKEYAYNVCLEIFTAEAPASGGFLNGN